MYALLLSVEVDEVALILNEESVFMVSLITVYFQ